MNKTTAARSSVSVRDMAFISLCSVLIAVCAWITIPSVVPFTLQTFAVFTVVALLGWKKGLFSVLIYILLGAVGLPVFAGFTGGVGVLFGSTGGYILGFIAMALIYGLVMHFAPQRPWFEAVALLTGLAACYAFGTAWFLVVYTASKGAITLGQALGWCVLPFIVPDVVKMILSMVFVHRLRKILPRL